MKTLTLARFKSFELDQKALLSLKGGLCGCKVAVPYDCQYNVGLTPGTGAFYNCLAEGDAGCMAVDPTCHQQ